MKVPRYELSVVNPHLGGDLEVERDDDYGDWCKYEDVAKLEGRVAELERALDDASADLRSRRDVNMQTIAGANAVISGLEAEVAELQEKLSRIAGDAAVERARHTSEVLDLQELLRFVRVTASPGGRWHLDAEVPRGWLEVRDELDVKQASLDEWSTSKWYELAKQGGVR